MPAPKTTTRRPPGRPPRTAAPAAPADVAGGVTELPAVLPEDIAQAEAQAQPDSVVQVITDGPLCVTCWPQGWDQLDPTTASAGCPHGSFER